MTCIQKKPPQISIVNNNFFSSLVEDRCHPPPLTQEQINGLVRSLGRLEGRCHRPITLPPICQPPILPPPQIGPCGIAANETARVWGDPHFEDPDGGKFDVQGEAGKTYKLLNDTGLQLNGRFDAAPGQTTVVGETGLTLTGPRGVSRIQYNKQGQALLGGRPMTPGMMVTTADGGHVQLSQNGKTLTVMTREGYAIIQEAKGSEMEIRVKSPGNGVATDGRMPGGLIGQTFDADKIARNSRGKQGEGAIAGTVRDYEVTSLDSITDNPLDWNPSAGDQTLDFMIGQTNRQAMFRQMGETNQKNDKLLQMLLAALQTGNIDLAMLLFSSLESREATQLTKALTQKLLEAQENRRRLTGQLTSQDKNAQNQTAQVQANVQEVNDTIQLLTTFIRDVNEQKNRTMEFANNFLNGEHQTTMSIVRGMKG